MSTLSLRTVVRNAAAVFSGCHGAVTRHAEQAGCRRQTVYDHARQIERRSQPVALAAPPAAVSDPASTPTDFLEGSTRRRLAVSAFAMGVSARRTEDLFRVILGDEGPDHATIGRWVAGAAGKAGPALKSLDAACVARVRTLAVDGGRPTLVGIEPASLTAVFCANTADRTAVTRGGRLAPFDRLEFAVSDAAEGIAKAVADLAAARRDAPVAPPPGHGLDVFHTAREAHRVLARYRRRADAAWEEAEAADRDVAGSKRQGLDARGVAQTARAARGRAVARFEHTERLESAWGRVRAAPDLFGPDGRPDDRARAGAEIGAALKGLVGPEWAKVRHSLKDRRGLALLDRMHRRRESAEPRRAWREAMAWRWWLRHRRPTTADPLTGLVRAAARERAPDPAERASYDRVAAVLKGTSRASSAVECMNGAPRAQQSRHRRMTQPTLDLKRPYWNCHPFRSGPRKDVSPYQALKPVLPTSDFWALLQTNPDELAQRPSTRRNEG